MNNPEKGFRPPEAEDPTQESETREAIKRELEQLRDQAKAIQERIAALEQSLHAPHAARPEVTSQTPDVQNTSEQTAAAELENPYASDSYMHSIQEAKNFVARKAAQGGKPDCVDLLESLEHVIEGDEYNLLYLEVLVDEVFRRYPDLRDTYGQQTKTILEDERKRLNHQATADAMQLAKRRTPRRPKSKETVH